MRTETLVRIIHGKVRYVVYKVLSFSYGSIYAFHMKAK